jgi:hypothetical protein
VSFPGYYTSVTIDMLFDENPFIAEQNAINTSS